MARGLVLALLLGLCGTATAAARARQVVVILPPDAGEDADLALAMQTRAAALLVGTGGFQDVHLKQILRVAERERLSRAALASPDGAAIMSRRFGAERVVYSKLARGGDGWVLTAAVAPGGRESQIKLPADPVRGFHEGALALARLAAGAGVSIPAGRPMSASAPAIAAYARCYAVIVDQPLVVDTPMVLDEGELKQAIEACRAAVAADGKFQAARAALGLALALAGQDEEAVQALAQVKEDGYLPLYWLGRYWLVTRYQSADAGETALKKAIERHPYFLLAQGYLAQHESVLRRDAAALAAWRDYQKQLPRSAFVRGGISHSLARLGRHDEAIAEAKAALAAAPDDREAKLELASRHIDAGQDAEAIALLAPLAEEPGTRAETLLRLGYAYARRGETALADKWLNRAEAAAQRPAEWRTRARARLDRGVLLIKSGRTDEGQALLVSAKRGGLAGFIDAQKDDQLRRMVKDAEAAQRDKKVLDFSIKVPKETSPFRIDGAGQLSGPTRPEPEPKMFEVLRF